MFKVQYRSATTGRMVNAKSKTRTGAWTHVLAAKGQGADASTLELRVREHVSGTTWQDVTHEF
jgi:hypothetical protein